MREISEYLNNVKHAIGYVEKNLTNKLKLFEIAEEACLSEFYFHRIFHQTTGMTIKDYILKRRMSEAAKNLISTNTKLHDLSKHYGFSNQESFTRAFKRIFRINPVEYRQYGALAHIFEPLQLNNTVAVNPGMELSELHVITIPAMYFIGINRSGRNEISKNYHLTHKFLSMRSEIPNVIDNKFYTLGNTQYDEHGNKSFNFYTTLRVSSLNNVPKGMIGIETPEQEYAVLNYKGNLDYIDYPEGEALIFDIIFNQIIPQNNLHVKTHELNITSHLPSLSFENEPCTYLIPVATPYCF